MTLSRILTVKGTAIVIGATAFSLLPAILAGFPEVALIAALPPIVGLVRSSTVAGSTGTVGSNSSVTGFSHDMLDDAILVVDRSGRIRSSNAAAMTLIGHDGGGRSASRYLPLLKDEQYADLSACSPLRVETELRRESSEAVSVEFTLHGQGQGDAWRGALRVTDISERAARTARLERLALHDALTGLPNRVLLHDRINQALAMAERQKKPMAILLLDLDKFKQVNDNLGHHVGDLLLQAVGPRLSGPLRKTDTLSRLGGDEFAVLLPPATDVATARSVAERLVEEILDPFSIEGMSLDLGVSIGVAVYPQHGSDLETLINNADAAMYKAKRGRLGYCVFDTEQDYQDTQKTHLQRQLKAAIDNGDLTVLYQPKVMGGDWRVAGMEALVRWEHPQRGILQPSEFIPLAEQTGLIMPLTLAVLNTCLEAQRQWRHADLDLSLAVNLSGKWLQDKTFPRILKLLLANWHGRADRLLLEVPESAIMNDPDGTLEVMRGIHEQGISLSLDDFGTGYSSLPMLQRLPIDELKIDRGFIDEMASDRGSAVVVRSVVKLAHGLGLRVVAEGVENRVTADWLSGLGCDQLQGFYFARPMAADTVPDWIDANEREVQARLSTSPA
ncbi:MAG: EAL domain-containing protein [Geminicoccaceae bacterium]|nr:EAL domain-containing protein [Geminicoccaceae bacterium]MCB9944494.1 EAL domain-containing protein [Geminicoccaceae bacterium]